MIPPDRDPRFDVPVIALGALAAAGLAVGGGFVVAALNRPGSDVGPTAATLTDAWNIGAGAGLGFLIGSASAAIFARSGSRAAAGVVAGGVACLADIVGFTIATHPADSSVADDVGFVVLALIFELAAVLIGAVLGSSLGAIVDGYRGRASTTPR